VWIASISRALIVPPLHVADLELAQVTCEYPRAPGPLAKLFDAEKSLARAAGHADATLTPRYERSPMTAVVDLLRMLTTADVKSRNPLRAISTSTLSAGTGQIIASIT
jgi:hypothetical protein